MFGSAFTKTRASVNAAVSVDERGVRVYACVYCPYTSVRSDTLRLHTRTHTGERPYACTLCAYRCNQANQLTRHMAAKHSDIVLVSKT